MPLGTFHRWPREGIPAIRGGTNWEIGLLCLTNSLEIGLRADSIVPPFNWMAYGVNLQLGYPN